jgi:predicted PurR-regulated permease PerM
MKALKVLLHAFGGRKMLASLATLLITVVCILVPLLIVTTQIFQESVQLYSYVVGGEGSKNLIISTLETFSKISEKFIPGTGNFFVTVSNNLDMYIKQGLAWIVQHLGAVLSGLSLWLVDLFIFFVCLYYLLRDGHQAVAAMLRVVPLDKEDAVVIVKRLHTAINSVLKGSLLIALLQGILTAVGFGIFGVPSALLWGMVTIVTSLIPGVGTGLIIFPGALYLFVAGNVAAGVGLVIWSVVIVGLVDNLLRPKLVGGALELHPLLILLSVVGGIMFFGPAGLFLGPIIISLFSAFITVYEDIVRRVKTGL